MYKSFDSLKIESEFCNQNHKLTKSEQEKVKLKLDFLNDIISNSRLCLPVKIFDGLLALECPSKMDSFKSVDTKFLANDYFRLIKNFETNKSLISSDFNTLILLSLEIYFEVKNDRIRNIILQLLTNSESFNKIILLFYELELYKAISLLLEKFELKSFYQFRNKFVSNIKYRASLEIHKNVQFKKNVVDVVHKLVINNVKEKFVDFNLDLLAFIHFKCIKFRSVRLELEPFSFLDITLDLDINNSRSIPWLIYSEITAKFKPVPESLADYFHSDRQDGYQALHFTVLISPTRYLHIRIRDKSLYKIPNERHNFQNERLSTIIKSISINELLINNFPKIENSNPQYYNLKSINFAQTLNIIMKLKEIGLENNYEIIFRGHKREYKLQPNISRIIFRNSQELEIFERQIVNDFMDLSHGFGEFNNLSQISNLAICQHYGLPTRLLDWTENPLIAMWFACNNPSKYPGTDAIIWCQFVGKESLALHTIDPFRIDNTIYYKPKKLIDRIESQSGWFSIHPVSSNEYASLEEEYTLAPLIKISIKAKEKQNIISYLHYLNINQFTIKSDLDGLAEWLKTKYIDSNIVKHY